MLTLDQALSSRDFLTLNTRQMLKLEDALHAVGWQLQEAGRLVDSEFLWRYGATVCRTLLAKEASNQQYRHKLARCLHNRAPCLAAMQRYQDAYDSVMESIVIRRQLMLDNGETYSWWLGVSLHNAGHILHSLQSYDESCAALEEAVEQRRHISRTEGTDSKHYEHLANSMYRWSLALESAGRLDQVKGVLKETMEMWTELNRRDAKRHGERHVLVLAAYEASRLSNADPTEGDTTTPSTLEVPQSN